MIFNAFQREDDDAVFTIVRNVSAAARAAGDSVVWDVLSTVDGVRVSVPVTATLSAFRGVIAEAIPDSGYGKCQIHGYNSYAQVANNYTTALVAGHILIPISGQIYLGFGGASDGKSGFVVSADTFATGTVTTNPTVTTKKVLIRAM